MTAITTDGAPRTVKGPNAELLSEVRSSLDEVLKDPLLNETWGGKDGKLDAKQAGLAAAVVAKMQEKLIDELKKAHERELRLVVGFWKLYRTPLFVRGEGSNFATTPEKQDNNGTQLASLRATIWNWGNLVGFTGIVIACVAVFYTRTYSHFKELAESRAKDFENAQKASESFRDLLGNREETLAKVRQQVIDVIKQKEAISSENQKVKIMGEKITPLLDKLSKAGGVGFSNRLVNAIAQLEMEAENYGKRLNGQQSIDWYNGQLQNEVHARQDLQAQVEMLLAEKAQLSTKTNR